MVRAKCLLTLSGAPALVLNAEDERGIAPEMKGRGARLA